MEVSHVRNRLRNALDAARQRAGQRREQTAQAEQSFDAFLAMAEPLARQLANALKVEGYPFTASTPGRSLRLASDRGRDDLIDIALDTSGPRPEVMAHVRFSRGSRTVDEERPVKPGASPGDITEEELLDFFVSALEPWFGHSGGFRAE